MQIIKQGHIKILETTRAQCNECDTIFDYTVRDIRGPHRNLVNCPYCEAVLVIPPPEVEKTPIKPRKKHTPPPRVTRYDMLLGRKT